MEVSFELLIYVIAIFLPLYGLYRASQENRNKKDVLINKLENLNDDLTLIKSSLDRETRKVLAKLEEMQQKLEAQKGLMGENAALQRAHREKTRVLLADLDEFVENQRRDLEAERRSFDCLVSSSLKTQ